MAGFIVAGALARVLVKGIRITLFLAFLAGLVGALARAFLGGELVAVSLGLYIVSPSLSSQPSPAIRAGTRKAHLALLLLVLVTLAFAATLVKVEAITLGIACVARLVGALAAARVDAELIVAALLFALLLDVGRAVVVAAACVGVPLEERALVLALFLFMSALILGHGHGAVSREVHDLPSLPEDICRRSSSSLHHTWCVSMDREP